MGNVPPVQGAHPAITAAPAMPSAFAPSSPPAPRSLGGGCSRPGSGCSTENPVLPALLSHGAEPSSRGDGTRRPRDRALPPARDPGSRKQKPPGVTAAPERTHSPARPSGLRAPAATPHPLPPLFPRRARQLSVGARRPPHTPWERGSGGDRNATGWGLGSPLGSLLTPFSLQARSKREAKGTSGGVSPNKPSQQRGARPLHRPAPPRAPEHPPLPIGSSAGGARPYIKAELGGSRRG